MSIEAFEKWWSLEYQNLCGHRDIHDEDIAEAAWRAALEWFYGKLGYSEEHEELKDLIEKELETEK